MRKNIPPIKDAALNKQFSDELCQQPELHTFERLTDSQYTKNSLLALRTDWLRFLNFCRQHQVTALPCSITTLRRFLEVEAKIRKFASIRRYSVSIGLVHTILGHPNPSSNSKVKLSLSQLRLTKHGDAKQANAFTKAHLDELFQQLHHSENGLDVRNLAIYGVMLECALKRSELKQLQTTDFDPETGKIIINGNSYQLSDNSSSSILQWLSMAGLVDGPLFRSIDRHGNIFDQPLDDSSIYRIIRKASDQLNLEGQLAFSGQSTRVGAAKELAQQGLNVKEIQYFGRWLSPAMPAQYMGNSNTAELEKMKFLNYSQAKVDTTQLAKNDENE